MLALTLAASAVVALLSLWVFSPLFIALVAAAVTVLLLVRAGRWLRHAGQPLPAAGWWAVLVCAALVCVAVLVLLPERLDGAPFLPVGLGLLAAACAGALAWAAPGWLDAQRPASPAWRTGAAGAAIAALLAVPLLGPDTAGWIAWREQLRGYEAVALRIVLHEAPTAQRQQALLELLQPLLAQGSRPIRHRWTAPRAGAPEPPPARVPARYRFDDRTLHIMLASRPAAPLLKAHVALLEQFAASGPARPGELPSWLMLSGTQCLPQASLGELGRAWRCTQQRSEQLQRLWPLLAGSVERVEVGQARRFQPWFGLPRWRAAPTPVEPAP